MNYKVNGLCALVIFVLGILFFCYDNALVQRAVLVMCGVAFFIPGLMLAFSSFVGKEARQVKKLEKTLRVVCGVAGVALAIVLWCMPDAFIPVISYLFGVLLIFAGVFHLIQMSSKDRIVAYPGWLVIGPVINIAMGVIILFTGYFHKQDAQSSFWLVFMTASGMLIFGAVGIFMSVLNYRAARHRKADARKLQAAGAEPVKGAQGDNVGKVSPKLAEALRISDTPEKEKPAKNSSDSAEFQGH